MSDWRVGSMCLRVPTARPRSTRRGRGAPQQATCTNGLRASRAVAGQAVGLHQNTTSGGEGGASGALLAPIDRREEMPKRKVASHPEAPVPARAATGRRRARARARRRPSGSIAPLRLRGDLREASRAADLSILSLYRPEPPQHAPPFPAAPASSLGLSARRQAEAPESCPVAPMRSRRARALTPLPKSEASAIAASSSSLLTSIQWARQCTGLAASHPAGASRADHHARSWGDLMEATSAWPSSLRANGRGGNPATHTPAQCTPSRHRPDPQTTPERAPLTPRQP